MGKRHFQPRLWILRQVTKCYECQHSFIDKILCQNTVDDDSKELMALSVIVEALAKGDAMKYIYEEYQVSSYMYNYVF